MKKDIHPNYHTIKVEMTDLTIREVLGASTTVKANITFSNFGPSIAINTIANKIPGIAIIPSINLITMSSNLEK